MITENLSTLKIHKLTQEQYDREDVAGNISPNEIYLIPVEDVDIQQQIEIALEEAKESGDFDGKDGADGTSVTVESVSESTEDGGTNVVTFSDGKTLSVKNGTKGDTGATGEKGDTGATGATGAAGSKWHSGTKVANDNTAILMVSGAKVGDFYLNTSTNNYYLAGSAGLWVKQGKLGMTEEETKAYIRSYVDELILNGEW